MNSHLQFIINPLRSELGKHNCHPENTLGIENQNFLLRVTVDFNIEIGVHQGLTLSPYLFLCSNGLYLALRQVTK